MMGVCTVTYFTRPRSCRELQPQHRSAVCAECQLDSQRLNKFPDARKTPSMPVTNVYLQSSIVERRVHSNHGFSDHFPLFVNSSNAEKSPSSIFFQTASIRALRSRPVSRFFLLFFPRSLDKHLLTSRFMSLQPPKTL
jgi:hypothetical protein